METRDLNAGSERMPGEREEGISDGRGCTSNAGGRGRGRPRGAGGGLTASVLAPGGEAGRGPGGGAASTRGTGRGRGLRHLLVHGAVLRGGQGGVRARGDGCVRRVRDAAGAAL